MLHTASVKTLDITSSVYFLVGSYCRLIMSCSFEKTVSKKPVKLTDSAHKIQGVP